MLTPSPEPAKTQAPCRLLLFAAHLFFLIASQRMWPARAPATWGGWKPLQDVIRTGRCEINTDWFIFTHKEKSEGWKGI